MKSRVAAVSFLAWLVSPQTLTQHMTFGEVINLVKQARRPVRITFSKHHQVAAYIALRNTVADELDRTDPATGSSSHYNINVDGASFAPPPVPNAQTYASPLYDDPDEMKLPPPSYEMEKIQSQHFGAAMEHASIQVSSSMRQLARGRGRKSGLVRRFVW